MVPSPSPILFISSDTKVTLQPLCLQGVPGLTVDCISSSSSAGGGVGTGIVLPCGEFFRTLLADEYTSFPAVDSVIVSFVGAPSVCLGAST